MNRDHRFATSGTLPLLVLVIAVIFCATLLSFVREPVFFLGDGGMKLLATQQFANGVFTSEVRLPAETWVKRLWESGYYPLEPPFVFPVGDAMVFGQPLIFPVLTAPFYALFGYRGLYVLPVVSFLLLAIGMHVGARRIGLSPSATAITHAGWVTSYVMLYSAIFWEHIPGTMLAVWGIVPVVEGLSQPVSRRRLAVAALLMGASGWLRPECLALAGIVIVVWLPIAARRSNLGEWALFSGLTVSVVACFLALNLYIFGDVLGMHAIPVIGSGRSEMEHVRAAVHLLGFFAAGVAHFAPVVLLLPILAVRMMYPVTSRGTVPFYFLVVCAALFLVTVSYMVPTEGGLQWGPRHVIPVVPLLTLAVGIGWQSAVSRAPTTVYARTAVFALVLIGYGAWVNMWVGARTLRDNYTRKILPTIEMVRANGADQIVVTDQSTAQEMAALMQDHRFYLAPNDDDQPERLAQLADAFLAAGRQRFLIVVAVEPDTQDPVEPTIATTADDCWTRRHLGDNTVGYVVYEFSRC